MPTLPEVGEEQLLVVTLLVQPRENLPRKVWEVEIETNSTIRELKAIVNLDYHCHPDILKISDSQVASDKGFKNISGLRTSRTMTNTRARSKSISTQIRVWKRSSWMRFWNGPIEETFSRSMRLRVPFGREIEEIRRLKKASEKG